MLELIRGRALLFAFPVAPFAMERVQFGASEKLSKQLADLE